MNNCRRTTPRAATRQSTSSGALAGRGKDGSGRKRAAAAVSDKDEDPYAFKEPGTLFSGVVTRD